MGARKSIEMMRLIPIFIFIFLVGCSPIKRHSRLVDKYPFVHQTDTIKIVDTFRIEIPKVQTDTMFLFEQLRDTIFINKERLKIRVHSIHDSIYIHGECDTIFKEKIIERKIPIKYFEKFNDWESIIKWMIVFLIVLILFIFFRKLLK